MTNHEPAAVTEHDWGVARKRTKHVAQRSAVMGVLFVAALAVPAAYLASLMASGRTKDAFTGVWLAVLISPLVALLSRQSTKEQERSDRLVAELARQLSNAVELADEEATQREVVADRQLFESRLGNALDIAEGEPEVIDVIERSFATMLADSPVELLLADNSHAHLLRMASSSPTGSPPGCGVDSPDHCPAARRAQVQRFSDSEELDACPKLRGRATGPLSALCVPVSIMGRTVGVIHAIGEQHAVFAENTVLDLENLAKLAGARIGLLRVMAETQLQASTDSLTGLLNRRSFEQRVSVVRRDQELVTLAMADLDHFKLLNDTYGHETGDRALRLFARVVRESVRAEDVICRHGGEEFLLALPRCSTENARQILQSVQVKLDAAITVAGLPTFTVSIGVVEVDPQEDLPEAIGRADIALFEAKAEGRDRIVVYDQSGVVVAPDGQTVTGADRLIAPRDAERAGA